ncbi:hypothetical protein FQN49_006115 [Arthroderma sp. PD_2]|nr:hypothetical protein FQN49_006115 [Arthroderma sp. PD_2]
MANPKEAELEGQRDPLLPRYFDDSDTVVGDEKIYTPPSTASNSGESQPDHHVEAYEDSHEQDHLLPHSPPPEYRDQSHTPRCQNGDVKVDIKDDFVVQGDNEPGEPEGHCHGRGRLCRWWKKRRDARRRENGQCRGRSCCMKMLVILKVTLIVWLTLWVVRWATVGFMRRHHRHHHQHPNDDYGCHSNSSREIVVRERSGSIYGIYPLHDLLDLRTNSGSVFVTIVPQPADPNDPLRPAKISIRSRTGNVFVRFKMPAPAASVDIANPPPNYGFNGKTHIDLMKAAYLEKPAMSHSSWKSAPALQPRPYEVDIQTKSGNVFAVVGFSTHASISTHSGSISAHLTPLIFENTVFPNAQKCKYCDDISIRTNTRSGNVWVSVTEPSFIASSEPEQPSKDEVDSILSNKRLDTRRNRHNRPSKWDRILEALNKKPDHGGFITCAQPELKANAYHSSRCSGNMAVSYPHSWAGKVTARSRKPGNVVLQGEGLHVIDSSRGGKKLVATKKPTTGRDDKMSWWGSEGNMGVFVNGRKASVGFNVRD